MIVKRPPAPERFSSKSSPERSVPWEIAVAGDLTDRAGEILENLVEVPFRSRGTIFFDSAGGSVYVGLALATIIRLRGLDARGIVAGECSSAALIPLATCNRRFVTPHSTLLFHPMRWHSEEDVRLEEAAEWARHFRALEEDMDQLLARLFSVPIAQIHDWTRPGRFVNGREFAAAGLAQLVDLFSGDIETQAMR